MNEIAQILFSQLGANRFVAMTGAKQFVALENGLRFALPRNQSSANRCTITLNANDTYTVKFSRVRKLTETTVDESEMIYADMLAENFTRVTGMYTRL